MQSNNPKLGLISNQSNQKYTDTQQENDVFELQDFGDDSDQIQFDDTICQNKAIVLANLDQEPITMVTSNNRSNQSQQVNQKSQFQASYPIKQQVPQVFIIWLYVYSIKCKILIIKQIKIVLGLFLKKKENKVIPIKFLKFKMKIQTQSTCMFCQIPQMIPKNKNVFICYNCKQINKLIFAYFICGTCRLTVMYQQGISNLINCTNCMSINYVQQPNLPNTFSQVKFPTIQVQYLVNQTQTISTISNQQQGQGIQQQQQRNQVSDLEAEFKELTN
ncbi:unnamed protein product [Paramecium pentaurelia]|uniref:Uncharacterized protein n=1 Tax=Paramecium pentaurelia TaxID=43138 RepID=A0A8S1S845_9CILI|nr:unnamed protein product [Paramecium pentaurelia]